jgi:hypothetical protein
VPDIHVPKLGEHRGKSILTTVLEVILIGVGVFLGLAGEQWRENARHRELAEQALRRFRTEIVENRESVAAVKDYHAALDKQMDAEFTKPADKRISENIHIEGIKPSHFDRSAWDLAIATQSLSYLDSDLALSLSNVYNLQGTVTEATRGLVQAMYVASPAAGKKQRDDFLATLYLYYNDMILYEPQLMKMYDDILPKIDTTLSRK